MRKVFLMSILLSVLFGACHRTSQKNAATVADVTTMQKSELFMILRRLPDTRRYGYCPER